MKRRWFLSYNSQDANLMHDLEAGVRRKDPDASIFFAPRSLRAGGYWLPSLADAIADSTAFVLLVGEKGLGPWQIVEYYEALDRRVKEPDYPVILILLEGQAAPGLPFLRQLHWVVTAEPASDMTIGKLLDAVVSPAASPGELWRFTAPYRGLASMDESDSEFFFGRDHQTVEVLNALHQGSNRLPILIGNSGVGKSSLAQAGVVAALKRQAWPAQSEMKDPWPHHLHGSRSWCFIKLQPGADPIRALVEPFVLTWQFDTTDPLREKRQREWFDSLRSGDASLRGLLDATQDRLQELGRDRPPVFFIYVDQGEELYVRAEERQRRRFSELLAESVSDPRLGVLVSLRSDFMGALQADEALFAVHRQINVPPLREAQLYDVVSRPARLLGARFETDGLAADIARRAADESAKDAGALPLLSYLLDDMWTKMVERADGVLRLPAQALELGGVLAERADQFLLAHPKAEDDLRRVLTLKLANVREDGEPTRRRARRSEFSDTQWQLVSDLADHPHRLLVTATVEGGETYAEVAHEAIFRRWEKLRDWIAAEREFLVWKSGLENERRKWEAAPESAKSDALLMGLALAQAQSWVVNRPQDLPQSDLDFVGASLKREALERKQKEQLRRRVQWVGAAALVLVTIFAAVAGVFAVDARTATDVAIRSQAKYDILKAAIVGTDRKLDLEMRRNVIARTARAVINDLTKNYDLLDGSTLNSLFELGAEAKSILWFDTAHENNQTETAAFHKLGFTVVPVSTIDDAIRQLRARPFNVVLTHFGNNPGGPPNSNAYRLKAAMDQASLTRFPIIIYTIGVTDEFICNAQRGGFYDETDMPAQLIEIVARTIRGQPRIEHCPT
jgi:hypothetical protein